MTSAADRDSTAVPSLGVRMGRAAAMIAVVAIAARFVGILRVFAQASAIGTGPIGVAYVTANRIPNIVFDVVAGGALSSVVAPVLAGPMAANDEEGTRRTASALLTWIVLALVPLSLLGMLVARPVAALMLSAVADPQLRADKVDVAARMLVVFMPQIALYGVGVVLTGVLQAHRRFLAPALAPLLSSLVVIGAYIAYAAQAGGDRSIAGLSRAEELTLSFGTTLGVAALTLPLLVPTRRLGLHLRPRLRMPGDGGSLVRRLALAGAIGLGAQQLATVVVLVLANRVVGAVVVYELAWTVFVVPWAVLAVPIATSVYPDLTHSAAVGDGERFATALAPALRAVCAAMLLAGAVLVAASRPAADLLLALADTPPGAAGTADLARAIAAFAPGLAGYGVVALLTRAANARHAGRAAAVATATGFAVAAAVDVVLVLTVPDHWLVAALGAGNSVGMTAAAALLLRWLHGTPGRMALAGAGRLGVVASAAAAASAAAGTALAAALPGGGGGAAMAALTGLVVAVLTIAVFASLCALVLRAETAAVVATVTRGRRERR